MGKGKKADKHAGKTKAKLPKRMGGVKLPKELRRAGGAIAAAVDSPAGRELMAAGLGLAAAALRASARKGEPAPPGAPATKAPPPPADPHEIGVALGKLAQSALDGLLKQKR